MDRMDTSGDEETDPKIKWQLGTISEGYYKVATVSFYSGNAPFLVGFVYYGHDYILQCYLLTNISVDL